MNQAKRHFVLAASSLAALSLLSACTTTSSGGGDPEAQRKAIDAGADSALARLYSQQRGSKELVESARGVLVFPSFGSAGFIVGGGSGRGVLRVGDKSDGYFRMTEASVGLLAGAQSQAVFLLFMLHGNHTGHVEDAYLLGFAIFILLIIFKDWALNKYSARK